MLGHRGGWHEQTAITLTACEAFTQFRYTKPRFAGGRRSRQQKHGFGLSIPTRRKQIQKRLFANSHGDSGEHVRSSQGVRIEPKRLKRVTHFEHSGLPYRKLD